MSGVKKTDLFLVSLLPGQQHTEAEMVWSSPQQYIEEKERRRGGEQVLVKRGRRGDAYLCQRYEEIQLCLKSHEILSAAIALQRWGIHMLWSVLGSQERCSRLCWLIHNQVVLCGRVWITFVIVTQSSTAALISKAVQLKSSQRFSQLALSGQKCCSDPDFL